MTFLVTWPLGEERLWKPFWLGDFVGGILVWIVFGMILATGVLGFIAGYFLLILFTIWINVSIWNCAPNVNWRGWMYIARGVVVLSVIGTLFEVVYTWITKFDMIVNDLAKLFA